MTASVPVDYGKPGTAAAALRQAVHECLLAHEANGELPTSNRFVLYELRQASSPALFGHKSRADGGRSEDQNVSDASKWLRDNGLVPWDWIADETRSLTAYMYAPTVAGFVTDSVEDARIDMWDGTPPPLLLCESRTFRGVLERTLAPTYLCPVTATNGQVGGFLHTNVAPILHDVDRPVLYIGDLDMRGHDCEGNTRRVLEQATGQALDWTRVALTHDQVREHELPVVMKRDKVKGEHPAVEVESLGQRTVTEIIRAAIEALLLEPADVVFARQREQRQRVRAALEALDGFDG